MLVLRRVAPRAPGALLAMALGILVVAIFDLNGQHGVAIVGEVALVRPSVGLPAVGPGDLISLLAGSAGVVFLAVGESLGSARSFAMAHHYEIDADQELVALGGANISSGLFGGFIVDASLSQSAAAETAGARTQLSSMVTAGLVLATALVLAPMFRDLPMTVLAAVVIASVLGLIDPAELAHYRSWERTDAVLAIAALVGVIGTDVLTGLVLAVLISIGLLLYRASRPYLAVLGRVEGEQPVYVDLARHEGAQPVSGLLLLRLDAPLYFFNASVARSQALERIDGTQPRPRTLVMDMGATSDLDVTTAEMLRQLVVDLTDRGVGLAMAHARGRMRDRLARTGLLAEIGEGRIHLSMADAVAAESARIAGSDGFPSAAPTEPVTARSDSPEDVTPPAPADG